MTKYRLPSGCHVDGVGEVEGLEDDATGLIVVRGPQGTRAYFHESDLTEVPPPIPAEPEPGAYLINGHLCVRAEDPAPKYSGWCTQDSDGSWLWLPWGGLVRALIPDVAIVPLIPDPAHGVTLPWTLGSVEVQLDLGHRFPVCLNLGEESARFTAVEAQETAAAILAGARGGAS